MIKKMFTVATFFLLVLYPLCARAVPILGVAPGLDEYGESAGIYNDSKPESLDSYHKFFTKTFVDYGTEDKGWVVPESGGDLAIWFGNDSADPDDPLNNLESMGWMDVDIWLVTDAWGATDDGFSFGGEPFVKMLDIDGDEGDKADGYFFKEDGDTIPPYYGVNLGSISDNPDKWQSINARYWPGEFYYYQDEIIYDDFEIGQVDWFFAIADFYVNGVFDADSSDRFSPQTVSSSNPIPEPATMLLLGAGLIGLAGLGRKKFFRKS